MQGAEPLFLPDFVCDQICQPSNEDEDEMKINSRYWTDPWTFHMVVLARVHMPDTQPHRFLDFDDFLRFVKLLRGRLDIHWLWGCFHKYW